MVYSPCLRVSEGLIPDVHTFVGTSVILPRGKELSLFVNVAGFEQLSSFFAKRFLLGMTAEQKM